MYKSANKSNSDIRKGSDNKNKINKSEFWEIW